VEASAIVPLPATVMDNKAAAFAPLAGESPLARVVRTMLACVSDPNAVVVASAEPLVGDVRESLAAHGLSAVGVAVTKGPATRADCLAVGLEHLHSQSISVRYVLVHDIRRPLAPADLGGRVIAELRNGSQVVMPALPVTDSVKAVDARGSVTGTLDRSALTAVQYPRGFTVEQLSGLLARRVGGEFDELDEAITAGVPITAVDGDSSAFPAELPRDTAFVEAIIACRREDLDL
jgi:2-C-methyl-D-erythritol 4-phosphate cytidylyltransferase